MPTKLVSRLANALSRAGIPYLVIGGQALLLYSKPRYTHDTDVVVVLAVEEYEKLLQTLGALGLRCLTADPGKFVIENRVLPFVDEKTRQPVEIIFSTAPFEKSAVERANVIELEGERAFF